MFDFLAEVTWMDWLGYAGSMIVLVSLLMSSIKRLRWINLFGAIVFGIYAILVNNVPTVVMNVGIALIDIYYLAKIYLSKDYFHLLPIDNEKSYLNQFIDFYEEEIKLVSDLDKLDIAGSEVKLYILRNMTPAGIFVCSKVNDNTLEIKLDYAIPQYRDFKLGAYLFNSNKEYFIEKGYNNFIAYTDEKSHINYLRRMGFAEEVIDGKTCYKKTI